MTRVCAASSNRHRQRSGEAAAEPATVDVRRCNAKTTTPVAMTKRQGGAIPGSAHEVDHFSAANCSRLAHISRFLPGRTPGPDPSKAELKRDQAASFMAWHSTQRQQDLWRVFKGSKLSKGRTGQLLERGDQVYTEVALFVNKLISSWTV
jgi:hypothetical protein